MLKQAMQETASVIGRKVRAKRRGLGLSQHALAEKSGVERAHITRLEQGEVGDRGVSMVTLVRIALALGVEAVDLMPGSRLRPGRSVASTHNT